MDWATTCRCCFSKGSHKDLNTSYYWMNNEEVYADLLHKCFNISLTVLEYNSICDSCVLFLRKSMEFKKLVLDTEKKFTEIIRHNEVGLKSSIKIEPYLEVNLDSDNDADPEYYPIEEVKEEALEEYFEISEIKTEDSRKRKSTRKPSSSKADARNTIKSMVNRLSCLSNLPGLTVTKKTKNRPSSSRPASKRQINIDPKFQNVKITTKRASEIEWIETDKQKHKKNLATLLQYSNCTPFKNRTMVGYICFFCDEQFQNPDELRKHSITEHKSERSSGKVNFESRELTVNMDIEDLKCMLCQSEMADLTMLKTHLSNEHKKIIYMDIMDYFVQYKLKPGDVYDCCMCTAKYEAFKTLKQHMNCHYRNYECNKCGSTFTTKRSLNVHAHIHKEGVFKCSHCDKVFSTKVKKVYHERCVHKEHGRKVGLCPYCNQTFTNYYTRNQHLVKEHNEEARYKCNVCGKAFLLKSLLMEHIKKLHLMEKNVQCTLCDRRFFSVRSLKNHMVKHTGEKNYKCNICQKAYGRKYTLREHMRIHNNDRRFRCEVCAMTFVQKCSLKSHLLSNHGISMAASEITANHDGFDSVQAVSCTDSVEIILEDK